MKKFVLLLVSALGVSSAFAQDILTYKDGRVENVKILSVSGNVVKFRNFETPDASACFELCNNLYSIQYENGQFLKLSDVKVKNSAADGERLITGQFDAYLQDGWGVGYMVRRVLNKYAGWNIFGTSFMSGWNNPREAGIVNVRAMGFRLNTPDLDGIKLFAEVTPGYSFIYLNRLTAYSWSSVARAHYFGLDFCAGFQIRNKVAIGYNLNYMTNSNGSDMSHWGRISVLF